MNKNYFSITLLLVLLHFFSSAQPVSQIFNASGTYIVPTGYSAVVIIEAWGGGGGGGATGNGGKGGGGGGAYATFSTTLPAGSYAVTVGSGGAGGVNGGNSSLTAICVAGGGGASAGTTAGAGGVVITGTGFTGGIGAGTTISDGGGGGGSATSIANGGNGAVTAGGTGQGNGGAGGLANNGNGGNGAAPGGGGGGKAGPGVGGGNTGVGATGRVTVTVTSVLDIKIYYLNVEKGLNFNTLNWQASCNTAEAIFDVERSADGRVFSVVNTIVASRERCLQPFAFTDNFATAGTLYYRIKITDIDGRVNYSGVVKVSGKFNGMVLAAILPNPVTSQAQLNITAAKKDRVEFAIVTLDGKIMQRSTVKLQAGSSIINLDVANLLAGVYIINGVFSKGETITVKFVKQ